MLSFRGNFSAWGKNELFFGGAEENEEVVELDKRDQEKDDICDILNEYLDCQEPGSLKRCSWITKASGKKFLTKIPQNKNAVTKLL